MTAFITTAKKAVMEAGKILRAGFLKPHKLIYKQAHYQAIATSVDFASERMIRAIIHRAYPTHALLGEERGMTNGTPSPYLWIIDPVDGTTNYVHGVPMFNVTVALQKDGRTILGAVYQPITDEFFFAIRDRGAWLNNDRMHVSSQKNIQKAYGFLEWNSEDPAVNARGLRIFTTLRERHIRVRNIGSGALVFTYIGAGRGEYAMSVDSKLWDVAAASLIIREAGGRVTDFNGRDPEHVWKKNPLATCPLLVTNGKIHQSLLRLVQ
ncbi:inositol monophosphatase [Candidatus Uhrbacteria bacterium]|nr:inositol monophosphatase [Candidatus Uhrbacteria bacterium]